MFFGKKKEVLDDQFAVYREREAPRYATGGGIAIEGFEGEGLLKNVSISGCCLESITYASITPGQAYQVNILPSNSNIKPFPVKLAASWTRSSEALFEAGFTLEPGQKNPQLEQYVELLQIQGVKPEYGNMHRAAAAGQ